MDASPPARMPRSPSTISSYPKGMRRSPASSAARILDALGRNPAFISAALPLKVFPPLFNRYRSGSRGMRLR